MDRTISSWRNDEFKSVLKKFYRKIRSIGSSDEKSACFGQSNWSPPQILLMNFSKIIFYYLKFKFKPNKLLSKSLSGTGTTPRTRNGDHCSGFRTRPERQNVKPPRCAMPPERFKLNCFWDFAALVVTLSAQIPLWYCKITQANK